MTHALTGTDRFDDAARWQAVISSDPAADGAFVYAVSTTGVYCRPSCRSRLPARRSVSFFTTPDEAECAGFRACRKCGGRKPGADDPDFLAVQKVRSMIEACDGTPPTLRELADTTGMSPHRLRRKFKEITGLTPREYRDSIRQAALRESLGAGEPVAASLYGAGFGSTSRLYESSDRQLGMTPARFGRGGAGTVIAHATAISCLGRVLVGATAKGVCFVALGDTDDMLIRTLKEEFPRAEHRRDDAGLGGMLEGVLGHLEGKAPDLRLPLDVRATAFQRQVWQALTGIPYGETSTYRDIAAAIGRNGAARAVGRACASNPVALLVPCHRVIGTDGDCGGYRWGRERKQALLDQERRTRGSGPSGDGRQ